MDVSKGKWAEDEVIQLKRATVISGVFFVQEKTDPD
jgi:hypothetical protein